MRTSRTCRLLVPVYCSCNLTWRRLWCRFYTLDCLHCEDHQNASVSCVRVFTESEPLGELFSGLASGLVVQMFSQILTGLLIGLLALQSDSSSQESWRPYSVSQTASSY